MNHRFVGRKHELESLRSLLQKRSASLVVIRGRRRIGKSRLVTEFAKEMPFFAFTALPPTSKTTNESQQAEFIRQMTTQLKGAPSIAQEKVGDWGNLFHHLAEHLPKKRVVVLLDEISWMGSKDPTFLGKLKIAWDLYFSQNPQLILVLCGSVSSWIEKNILKSTGFFGRISSEYILQELSLAECNEFWDGRHDLTSSYDKFKVLSVTGGVPWYLEQILPANSAEENIHALCFQPSGSLFHEFDRIFSDLFSSRSALYKRIVERLAKGPCTLEQIYRSLRSEKSGVFKEYLNDLKTSGFVAEDKTWHLKSGAVSKLSLFRLKDNYLRFYLKTIEPNRDRIESQTMKIPSEWPTIMGLQFENLVLANRQSLYEILHINQGEIVSEGPYFQRKTSARPGCQIDLLIQTRFGTCYVCEVKFSTEQISTEVIRDVQKKIQALARPKHTAVIPILIHVNGVNLGVKESGYFSKIIGFEELLQQNF